MQNNQSLADQLEELSHLDGGKYWFRHPLPEAFWLGVCPAFMLHRHVIDRAQNGGNLAKAFRLFMAEMDGDNFSRNPAPALLAAMHALAEWEKLTESERSFIFNGWRYLGDFLPSREILRGSQVAQALRMFTYSDHSEIYHEHVIDGGESSPVSLVVKAGYAKNEVIACLSQAVTTLEKNWDSAVSMRLGKWMSFDESESLIGKLISDEDESGIVIATHEGTDGTLVIYRNAKGEVNAQYKGQIKVQVQG